MTVLAKKENTGNYEKLLDCFTECFDNIHSEVEKGNKKEFVIYFIRSYNKFVKIGCSNDPENRLKELQTASPVKLTLQAVMPGEYKTEKGLHELFEKDRAKGEWFRYSEGIKWFIRIVKENPEITNIRTVYDLAEKARIEAKARRLGKNHNLSKRIARYSSR